MVDTLANVLLFHNKGVIKYPLLLLVYLYRLCFKPFNGACCRFYPSCSEYALDALKKKGGLKGGWLISKRLLKCGPWHPGGYDPVE